MNTDRQKSNIPHVKASLYLREFILAVSGGKKNPQNFTKK